jgi:hypothetical protein
MKSVVLVGSKSEGWGACSADAVVVLAFFLAVARLTRMGRLERTWAWKGGRAGGGGGGRGGRCKGGVRQEG